MRQNTPSGFSTQAERIESLLRSRYGQWIPAYELAALGLQYCARINSIRKKLLKAGDRERIENKTEWVNGQCHGSYRIVSTAEAAPISSFSAPECEETELERPARDTRHNRALEFERTFGKPCPSTTDSTTTDLPLFDMVRR